MRRLSFPCLLLLLVAGSHGPARAQNGWTGGGPDGGWVVSLLAPYGPEGPLLAGTYGGGVFRSNDGGETWFSISRNAADAVVWELEFSPDANATLYAATDDRSVLRQTFGFDTWGAANTGLEDPTPAAALAIEVDPEDPTRLVAATSRGVYHSENRGGLWPDSLAWAVGNPMGDVEVPPGAPSLTYAISNYALFASPNRGRTVEEWFQGLPPNSYLFDLELWPSRLDSMVMTDYRGEVWQFRDERFVAIGPEPRPGVAAPHMYRARVLGGASPRIWVASSQGLYRSEDVGASWSRHTGGSHPDLPELWALLPDDPQAESFWLGSFRQGLLHTGPLASEWQEKNVGLRANWVRALCVWDDFVLAGTAHGTVHLSADGGESWQDVTGDLDALQLLAIHRVRGTQRWLVASTDGVFRTDDGGEHWSTVPIGGGRPTGYRFLQAEPMGDEEVLLGTIDGVRVSRDGGASFGPLEGMESYTDPVVALAMAADSTLVIASEHFSFSDQRALFVGRWGETQFERLVLPGSLSRRVRGLAFVSDRADRLVLASLREPGLATVARVEHFLDPAARVFVPLDAGLPVTVGTASHLVGDRRGRLYLSFDGEGVFESRDGGDTWKDLGAGLPSPRVDELALRRGSQPRLYAATLARGVFGRDLESEVPVLLRGPSLEVDAEGLTAHVEVGAPCTVEMWRGIDGAPLRLWWTGEVQSSVSRHDDDPVLYAPASQRVGYEVRLLRDGAELARASTWMALPLPSAPARNRLYPGRPNPFNPRTTLALEVATPAWLDLQVFDARGRLVRTLFAGTARAGRHEFRWDGRDDRGSALASGVYIVRAQLDGERLVQRLTLVR